MTTARIDANNRVWCGVCQRSLGEVTERRWWPPGGHWHHVVADDGAAFYRKSRGRGRKWRESLQAAIGRIHLPGREPVGRNRLGVEVECPECLTVQHIDG